MFSGNTHEQTHHARQEGHKAWEKTKEGAENVKDKAAEESNTLGDKIKSGWDKTKEGAESGWEKTKEGAQNVKEKIIGKSDD